MPGTVRGTVESLGRASKGSFSWQNTAMARLRPLTVSSDVLVDRTATPNSGRSTSGRPRGASVGLPA